MGKQNYEQNEVTYDKELDLSMEEIEGYASCPSRTQMCLTDCPWPFDGAYLSNID